MQIKRRPKVKSEEEYDTYRHEINSFKTYYCELSVWKELEVDTVKGAGNFSITSKYPKLIDAVEKKLKDYDNHTDEKKYKLAPEYEKQINSEFEKREHRFELTKILFACPRCHKVHSIEDTMKVKPEFTDIFNELKEERPHVVSMLHYERFSQAIFDTMFYRKKKTDEFPYSYQHRASWDAYIQVCPECGTVLSDNEYEYLRIENALSNHVLRSYTIFHQEDKVKLSCLFRSYYINHKAEKIVVKEYRVKYVFNTKTGRSYLLGPTAKNGKKISEWKSAPIVNTTYHNPYATYGPAIIDETSTDSLCILRIFLELLKNKNVSLESFLKDSDIDTMMVDKKTLKDAIELQLGLEKPACWYDAQDAIEESYPGEPDNHLKTGLLRFLDSYQNSIDLLSLFNRFPYFNLSQLLSLSKKQNYNPFVKKQMSPIYGKLNDKLSISEIAETICNAIEVAPTKGNRKMVLNDISSAINIKLIKRFGFRDINIIRSILNDEELMANLLENASYVYSIEDNRNTFNFVKHLIRLKGEPTAYKLLAKCSSMSTIVDTARMFYKLKQNGINPKNLMKGQINEIHDRLSTECQKIRYKNVEIPYGQKSQKYNFKVDNFKFHLAKDTNELVQVGQEMHICVGTYRDIALSGESIIVVMTDESKGKYVGCIELNKKNGLKQAKAVCNNLLQEKKAEALKNWVDKMEITTDGCYDYEHIQKGQILYDESQIYQSEHDYHGLELDEDGNVVDEYERRQRQQEVQNQGNNGQEAFMTIPDDADGEDYLPFN